MKNCLDAHLGQIVCDKDGVVDWCIVLVESSDYEMEQLEMHNQKPIWRCGYRRKLELASQVEILDEAFWISLRVNASVKSIDPYILFLAIS